MALDPATQWLLDDAKRQGLTLSEYERQYGVILSLDGDMPLPSPAEQRIGRNELRAGLVSDDEIQTAAHFERNYVRDSGRRRPMNASRRPRACTRPTRAA